MNFLIGEESLIERKVDSEAGWILCIIPADRRAFDHGKDDNMPFDKSAFRTKRPVILNVGPDDDSSLQLAAMILAVRDSFVKLIAELTGKGEHAIETAIDDDFERYYDSLLAQVREYKHRNP